MLDYPQCQSYRRVHSPIMPDGGRCPHRAKGAFVCGLHKGVRLLCGQHGNMPTTTDLLAPDHNIATLPPALRQSLTSAEQHYQRMLHVEVARLNDYLAHSEGRLRAITAIEHGPCMDLIADEPSAPVVGMTPQLARS